MRLLGLLLLSLAVLPVAAAPPVDTTATTVDAELSQLTGNWVPVLVESEGQRTEGAGLNRLEFRDLPFAVRDGKLTLNVRGKSYRTDLQINPTVAPKTMDCIFTDSGLKGTVYRRIYRLDGDTLTLCYDGARPTELPAAFSARGTMMIATYKKSRTPPGP
jgi:uncharacterized protein (TIGR03067 family)